MAYTIAQLAAMTHLDIDRLHEEEIADGFRRQWTAAFQTELCDYLIETTPVLAQLDEGQQRDHAHAKAAYDRIAEGTLLLETPVTLREFLERPTFVTN